MKNPTIEFKNVSKKLGQKQILNDINFTAFPGEVISIIGRNGSGKTTILRLIAGLMYPDKGEVRISGTKVYPGLVGNLPTNIGALIEEPKFLPFYSALKNLEMLAGIRGRINKDQIISTLKLVGLDPTNKKGVKSYSQGMRQRLGIGQAIMESPGILIMDEPTNGLDAQGVLDFKRIIREQISKEVVVVLVSHVQEDIEELSDKILVLENGALHPKVVVQKQNWIISVATFEEIEKLHQLLPEFRITPRENNLPTGVCQGVWQSEKEIHAFLQSNGIKAANIRGGKPCSLTM